MIFQRTITPVLQQRALSSPIVLVTGPLQSGKTTACRQAWPELPYANLERADLRASAALDPAGFLARFTGGAVLDGIQYAATLPAELQMLVRSGLGRGPYVLIDSSGHWSPLCEVLLSDLDAAVLELLPLSLAELAPASAGWSVDELILRGGYPGMLDHSLDHDAAWNDHFVTTVEWPFCARAGIALRHRDAFCRFMRLAAAHVGQVLDIHALAADAGMTVRVARNWLGLLEASYIVRLLPPWPAGSGNPAAGTPKLYFWDVGLAAWLAGITEAAQLQGHPARAGLFENLVVIEFFKHALHHGQPARLHYWRDDRIDVHVDVNLVVEYGVAPGSVGLVQIDAAPACGGASLEPLRLASETLGAQVERRMLVHGGSGHDVQEGVEVVGLLSS